MNPWKVLGLPDDASDADVKKAYRDLVKKTHPDKGGSSEKFREINEAYTQIMNGEDPTKEFPDLQDLFHLFASMSNLTNLSIMKGPTIRAVLKLTLEQIENGGNFTVSYRRNVPTGKFNSSIIHTPIGIMNALSPEEMEKIFEVNIDIPRCHDHRKPLVFSRLAKADSLPPGDLEVNIILVKHPVFTRIDLLDLQIDLDISLKESLVGFDREIQLLNSSEVFKVECRSVVNPYEVKIIKRYGMKASEEKYGDLIIKFRIKFPVLLSDSTLKIIKSLDDI